ncbi:hypothetical protein ACTG9Q_24680 [Actinokineospora sp. 24-640]
MDDQRSQAILAVLVPEARSEVTRWTQLLQPDVLITLAAALETAADTPDLPPPSPGRWPGSPPPCPTPTRHGHQTNRPQMRGNPDRAAGCLMAIWARFTATNLHNSLTNPATNTVRARWAS